MMRWKQAYSAILRISGPDANSYIQGQFSNDLSGEAPVVRYGLWLDHKGKVRGDSMVLGLGGGEWLAASYFCPVAELKAHLERFIVADDVTVADETERWIGLGAWGGAAEAVAGEIGAEPREGQLLAVREGWTFRGRRSRARNIEILAPRESSWAREWAARASVEDCERERIRGAIPAVPLDIGPEDLPNEGGLEAEAISFTKGCFTGQEVMARLKNLGQVRRRLHVVSGPGPVPAARAALFQGERKVGEVRTAVATSEGFVALAMLSLLHLDAARGLSRAPEAEASLAVNSHG